MKRGNIISRIRAFLTALFSPKPSPVDPPFAIQTERLLLRDLEVTDVVALHAYRSDPEVLRYLARPQPYSQQEVYSLIVYWCKQMRQKPRELYVLAVVLPDENRLIGECCLSFLYPMDTDTPADPMVLSKPKGAPDGVVIGFVLHAQYWGQGYATEVAQALLRFAFVDLGMICAYAGCLAENTASRRVIEKVGMHLQGTQRDFPGSPPGSESLVFSIDATKWREGHQVLKETQQAS